MNKDTFYMLERVKARGISSEDAFADLPQHTTIDCCYSSIGTAIYK